MVTIVNITTRMDVWVCIRQDDSAKARKNLVFTIKFSWLPLNSLLNSVPDSKRIYTIESGARELSLLKRDAEGRVINNVVHTLSRPSENPNSDISQEDLVMAALRFDPDVICVGEMRDAEAHSAVEASSTDHTVVTTVHGGGGIFAHQRIAFLSQRRFPIAFDISMRQAAQAFPVVVFAHKLEDNSRKVMDISECVVGEDGIFTVIAGEEMDFCYGDLQAEMDMINRAYIEVMTEGDAKGRPRYRLVLSNRAHELDYFNVHH